MVDRAIAELTGVKADVSVPGPVYVYGRPQGYNGPTLHKASSKWVIWHPYADKPIEREVTLIRGAFIATREGDSPDHLIEIPAAHAMVLDLEDFVLPAEHVERVRRNIAMQRQF
jgi:hypothetical protein